VGPKREIGSYVGKGGSRDQWEGRSGGATVREKQEGRRREETGSRQEGMADLKGVRL